MADNLAPTLFDSDVSSLKEWRETLAGLKEDLDAKGYTDETIVN